MLCKRFKTLFFLSILLFGNSSYSLNIFELSLIGIGTSFVINKYYDNSISVETTYEKKITLLERYFENSVDEIPATLDYNLPIEQQMLIIEQIRNINNY